MFRLTLLLAALAVASARNVVPRIIGGKPTTIEQYPYQVGITTLKNFRCGGSLVSTQHVITAAHCTEWLEPKDLLVRVGSSYRISGGYLIGLEGFKIHDNFRIQFMDYDVAVFKLIKPIKFSASASPISLASVKDKRYSGEMVVVTGWGMTEYDFDKMPKENTLQVARLAVWDNAKCKEKHKHYLTQFTVTDRVFCAGGNKDEGTLRGDSGSPLVNEKKQLVGIVSWGHAGNITGYPGVHMDVTHPGIRAFIDKNIK